MRQSPARATPADHGSWLPVPDVSELPELEDLLEPHCLVAPRSARQEGNVRPTPTRPRPTARPSPARARPHDAGAWLPVPDVDLLPELEELLAPDKLVPEPVRPAPDADPALPDSTEPHAEPTVARRPPEPAVELPAPPAVLAPAPAAPPITKPATAPAPRPRPRTHIRPVARPAPAPSLDPVVRTDESLTRAERLTRATEALTRTEPVTRAKPLTRGELHAARVRVHVRRRGRHALILACVIVTVVALAGVLIPKFRDVAPEVDLRVDGNRISVRTDVQTVGGLLRDRGVIINAADRVSPSLATKITDGLDVKVMRARPVTLDRDGVVSRLKTTATTPAEVLEELGLDESQTAVIDPPRRLGAGKMLKLRTIRSAWIAVDGANLQQRTPALNVKEFLALNGVVLNPFDTVTPSLDTPITDGIAVTVARITGDVETLEEDVAAPTEKRDDPNLPVGQQKTIQPGAPGKSRMTYQVTRQDGQVVDRKLISNVPIKPAVPTIIAVGTKRPSGGGGSNIGSSGSTTGPFTSPTGVPSVTGSASWYQSPFGNDSCATKEYIPKGTTIRVTNLETGQSILCRVADRVEAGRVVDMDREAFAQLKDPSHGVFAARVDW